MTAKRAVISGASKGIGYAIAKRLAADGAEVGLLTSNAEHLQDAAARIQKEIGRRAAFHAVDLRTSGGCEEAHRAISEALGGCDILVNSAGATKGGSGRISRMTNRRMALPSSSIRRSVSPDCFGRPWRRPAGP